jgi:hypothetical protein
MTAYRRRLSYLTACLVAMIGASVQTQIPPAASSAPEATVIGAPYAADSIVTVKLTAFGDVVTQQVVARVYRDSAGRVRREQAVGSQETPKSGQPADLVVTIVDPVAGVIYSLNPATRTAHRLAINDVTSAMAMIPSLPASPAGGTVEALGTKQIDGLAVTGQRTLTTLPAGTDGRPVEIVEERWESRDLRLVVLASHRDSRTGEFEHRLTNITRAEPSAQLFTIPANYTIVDAPARASR